MLGDLPDGSRVTVGADKAYDTAAFVAAAREMNVTPHVTQNINGHRGSNIDERTTRPNEPVPFHSAIFLVRFCDRIGAGCEESRPDEKL